MIKWIKRIGLPYSNWSATQGEENFQMNICLVKWLKCFWLVGDPRNTNFQMNTCLIKWIRCTELPPSDWSMTQRSTNFKLTSLLSLTQINKIISCWWINNPRRVTSILLIFFNHLSYKIWNLNFNYFYFFNIKPNQ